MRDAIFPRRASSGRRTPAYVGVVALLSFACSGDHHAPPPPIDVVPDSGGAGGHRGVRSVGDGGSDRASDSAASGDQSRVGASPDATTSDAGSADAGCQHPNPGTLPQGRFVCSPTTTWGRGSVIRTASTPSDDAFAAITPDELTIVWMSTDDGAPVLNYADRASASDPFDPFGSLSLKTDYFADERAAVSPDGARIVVLRKDRKGFGEFIRQGRFYSFDPSPSEAAFAALDSQGAVLETSEFFGDPVLSSDDRTFFYSRYGAGEAATVFAATRSAPVSWPLGTPVEGAPLMADCGGLRRPTGISADGLTLFYFDESSRSERASWRTSLDAPFSGFVDLGSRRGAQPNARCTALYFSAAVADASTGTDEFVSNAE